MTAVHRLGINNAVPKCILALMNVDGMTRENVASHLQKYRLALKKLAGVGANDPIPDAKVDEVQAIAMKQHQEKQEQVRFFDRACLGSCRLGLCLGQPTFCMAFSSCFVLNMRSDQPMIAWSHVQHS